MNIQSSIIPNSAKVETMQNIHQLMKRKTACGIYKPWNLLLRHKKEWSLDTCGNVDESWNHQDKWQKPDMKAHVPGDYI